MILKSHGGIRKDPRPLFRKDFRKDRLKLLQFHIQGQNKALFVCSRILKQNAKASYIYNLAVNTGIMNIYVADAAVDLT